MISEKGLLLKKSDFWSLISTLFKKKLSNFNIYLRLIILIYIMIFILYFNILTSCIMIFLAKNPVYSILYLIFCFLNATVLLLSLGIDFLSLIFIIIYIGAVAVLFIFIVMMLNLRVLDLKESFFSYIFIAFFLLLFFILEFYMTFKDVWSSDFLSLSFFFVDSTNYSTLLLNKYLSFLHNVSNLQNLSHSLYLNFFIILWLAGILLLCAMIGIIIIALHKNLYVKRQNFYSQLIREEVYALLLKNRIFKKKLNWSRLYKRLKN